ncbi:MAG: hypothetical protein IJ038_04130 [Clostridia bacterium]|nr:hypothetical protein [Clostridia bacterium]
MNKIKRSKADRKTAPHFNAVDAMIIILVIVAIVGIYFRHNIIEFLTDDRNDDEYVVSFAIEDIRYTTPNYMNVGDSVYFSSDGELLGTLMSESENQGALNITPASKYFTDSNGEVHEIFYPNEESRVNARGRLLCVGSYNEEGGFCIDGSTYIAAGQSIEVYTEFVSVNITVTSIEIYEEE